MSGLNHCLTSRDVSGSLFLFEFPIPNLSHKCFRHPEFPGNQTGAAGAASCPKCWTGSSSRACRDTGVYPCGQGSGSTLRGNAHVWLWWSVGDCVTQQPQDRHSTHRTSFMGQSVFPFQGSASWGPSWGQMPDQVPGPRFISHSQVACHKDCSGGGRKGLGLQIISEEHKEKGKGLGRWPC